MASILISRNNNPQKEVVIKEKIKTEKVKKDKKPMTKTKRKALIGYSFVAIWIVGFAFFTLYPFVMSVGYSLSDVTITASNIQLKWNNFANFRNIFVIEEGFTFLEAMLAFGEELLIEVPIILVFSIIIALLLNQNIKCKGLFRAIYFLPVIIASGPVIAELLATDASGSSFIDQYGVISLLSNQLPAFLSKPLTTIFSKIIIVFWFSGVQIIIFLSGLQKISSSTYEAAKIDGAGPWECFWKITLPSLRSMILINGIYSVVSLATFSENGCIKLLKANMNSTITGYGFASALSWLYLVLVLVFLGLVYLLFRPKK